LVVADGEHGAALGACNRLRAEMDQHAGDMADYLDRRDLAAVPPPRPEEPAVLQDLRRVAPALVDVLLAERPLFLVDFIHSARRVWGSFDYYQLKCDEELVSTLCLMTLKHFAADDLRAQWWAHLPAKAVGGVNRLASSNVVAVSRAIVRQLIETQASTGLVMTLVPSTFKPWVKNLGHGLLRKPRALVAAQKSTRVFLVALRVPQFPVPPAVVDFRPVS
jgi:hypothetical protein